LHDKSQTKHDKTRIIKCKYLSYKKIQKSQSFILKQPAISKKTQATGPVGGTFNLNWNSLNLNGNN
jgi:hypothetical protein